MESELLSVTLPENLSPALTEKLKRLAPGTYCIHRSWGFGKIKDWDSVHESVIIDFKSKHGHVMQFAYAAESLTPLASDHVSVQKAESLSPLRKKALENPVAVIQDCIRSLGPQATADHIQALLSPEVIPAADYKKWWDSAKRALKKNGHFYVPGKKNEALRELDAPSALGDSALENLRLANGPKAILFALATLGKYWPEIKSEPVLNEIAELLEATLSKIPKSQLPIQIELALARDEFFVQAGRTSETGPWAITALTPLGSPALSNLLDALPGSRQPKLLDALRTGLPEAWAALFLGLLPRANGRVAEVVTEAFQAAGRESEVQAAVNRYIRERNITCDFLFWLCKNRPTIYGRLIEPQLFMAILSVLEKDQLSEIKKGTKLYELVLGDKPLIAAILKDAPVPDVRDITRAILLSPVFEELDKRSLLAAIIKLYPEVQAMVVGTDKTAAPEAKIIVSWPSLKRRQAELEEIVTKKIPQNSKDIGIARGYGDLKENHEFKSAREMQGILTRQKAELELDLARAEATDFAGADVSKVSLGTKVTLKDTDSGDPLVYTILGAWDGDLSKGIISYQTAVARALLNHTVGERIELSTGEGGVHHVVIEKIEPHDIDLSIPS
ncbi:MAG TPA: GreA/GreB family elongation factor [Candidatus Methylacidiphilales bacterium]|jgi:transcription elongation GreA/GreB family factor|nr:GreA/GreB family elongation factor [Candidatus Methylacidiphilales bacterium]